MRVHEFGDRLSRWGDFVDSDLRSASVRLQWEMRRLTLLSQLPTASMSATGEKAKQDTLSVGGAATSKSLLSIVGDGCSGDRLAEKDGRCTLHASIDLFYKLSLYNSIGFPCTLYFLVVSLAVQR